MLLPAITSGRHPLITRISTRYYRDSGLHTGLKVVGRGYRSCVAMPAGVGGTGVQNDADWTTDFGTVGVPVKGRTNRKYS